MRKMSFTITLTSELINMIELRTCWRVGRSLSDRVTEFVYWGIMELNPPKSIRDYEQFNGWWQVQIGYRPLVDFIWSRCHRFFFRSAHLEPPNLGPAQEVMLHLPLGLVKRLEQLARRR